MSIERLVAARTELAVTDETEIWDLTSAEANAAFDALGSETARRILSELYDSPATASELADALDMSLQNADYHLQKLRGAGLIEIATTKYSVTGNEMKVYAPTSNAVLLLSKDSIAERVRARLTRLFSGILIIGLGAIIFRTAVVDGLIDVPLISSVRTGGDDAGMMADDTADTELADADPGYSMEALNPLDHLPILLDPGVTFLFGAIFAVIVILSLRQIWWRRLDQA